MELKWQSYKPNPANNQQNPSGYAANQSDYAESRERDIVCYQLVPRVWSMDMDRTRSDLVARPRWVSVDRRVLVGMPGFGRSLIHAS